MNKLTLAKSEPFGLVNCDFWQNDQGDVFMTIAQLAGALGYSDRSGVDKIVQRNEYLEEADFSVQDKLSGADGKLYTTRLFTEDGIYEVAMLSKTPMARKFRGWVREVIKTIRKHGMYAKDELLDNPDLLLDVVSKLKEERDKRIAAERRIELDRPKVVFAEALETSSNSILIGELAKILKQNGIDIGQNRLFALLREQGYLGRKGEYYNMPTQRAMELGLFEIKTRTINNPDGSVRVTKTTKVTTKGQMYFVNKFKNEKLPA